MSATFGFLRTACTMQRGVDKVASYQPVWESARPYVDATIHADVSRRLETQLRDARWWRDACLQYFAQFSGMEIPSEIAVTMTPLEDLMKIKLPITNHESPSPALLDSLRP